MPLTCNINARGKAVRLIWGILLIAAGTVTAIAWAYPKSSILGWVISVALVLGGAFAVFEARVGWCVIRAMGWKTPM